jgi:hypothetical protein
MAGRFPVGTSKGDVTMIQKRVAQAIASRMNMLIAERRVELEKEQQRVVEEIRKLLTNAKVKKSVPVKLTYEYGSVKAVAQVPGEADKLLPDAARKALIVLQMEERAIKTKLDKTLRRYHVTSEDVDMAAIEATGDDKEDAEAIMSALRKTMGLE